MRASTGAGEIAFHPTYSQRGRGPHLLEWAYASDERGDAFHSNITASHDAVRISDAEGMAKFAVNVRWNVEGFGYLFMTADNGGEFYELPAQGKSRSLNLNFELARSRVARNRLRLAKHCANGWKPSREVQRLLDIAEMYREDAAGAGSEPERGSLSQSALLHALWAGEKLELEKATDDIGRRGSRDGFFFGCDARGIFQMHEDLFMERFTEIFNYATITHVWKSEGVMEDFEPEEGKKQYEMRELMFHKLRSRNITVEGRPLFWFHKWVTPGWLKSKTFDQLKRYVETTTREVVGHYGDGMYAWEIVNELHDWANECRLNPEQTVELTRLACDVAKDTSPHVHRLINNCCPFAEYVQLKQWSGQEAEYRQRTPWQFMRDLSEAGVDYTLIGQQMYYPYRDLQDIVILLERFEAFGRPLHLSEIGAPGGPTEQSVKLGTVKFTDEPYTWRRPWDEELQADWLEGVYTIAYSKPFIEGAHWFDFVDPFFFIDNGGILRSSEGEKKAAYDRLANIRRTWTHLPHKS
jgi:GH35 family endo-1,4-beta-xylanase